MGVSVMLAGWPGTPLNGMLRPLSSRSTALASLDVISMESFASKNFKLSEAIGPSNAVLPSAITLTSADLVVSIFRWSASTLPGAADAGWPLDCEEPAA